MLLSFAFELSALTSREIARLSILMRLDLGRTMSVASSYAVVIYWVPSHVVMFNLRVVR
jgi:hypothetical protein